MNLSDLYDREAEAVRKVVEKEAKGGVDINGRVEVYEIRQEIAKAKRAVRV